MPRSEILECITKDMRGIEIAPWHSPLASKSEGYNCLVLDVFDTKTLRERAAADPNIADEIISNIEDVDFVGSATEIASLIPEKDHGAFDYIVSSHNFEHLPNPIKFLQGCQTVLKPGGILAMAIPDARACFDIFRPHTTVVDWLAAFKEMRAKPSPDQIFEHHAYSAALMQYGREVGAFSTHRPISDLRATGDLTVQYRNWLASTECEDYQDTHCTVMTPASFELLILECQHLGLVSMAAESAPEPEGCEFYVRLVNCEAQAPVDINAARTALMRRMLEERFLKRAPSKWRSRFERLKLRWRAGLAAQWSL